MKEYDYIRRHVFAKFRRKKRKKEAYSTMNEYISENHWHNTDKEIETKDSRSTLKQLAILRMIRIIAPDFALVCAFTSDQSHELFW